MTVAIQGPSGSGDTVSVGSAVYINATRVLTVRAASSVKSFVRNAPTLRVYVTATNELIGALSGTPEGDYSGSFSVQSNPQQITIRSTLGGSADATVVVGRDPR